MEERHYLNVPFKEKDAAKALGARYDPESRRCGCVLRSTWRSSRSRTFCRGCRVAPVARSNSGRILPATFTQVMACVFAST
ncbi:DUF5710 domain-containing protein [Variovorax sp. J22P240]|uniref:DUF5710 domain-containing protein n=1 Tax=Variovorax sp. J22P240 TaxID=3053514 RepID=UPI00336578F0